LHARIHGYLPEHFIGAEYHSLTDNFTCDEMYTVESDVFDARAEISTLSLAEAIEEFGFTLMKGSPVFETQRNFRNMVFADAITAVASLFSGQKTEFFADPQYITLRHSGERGVVPCLHTDYSLTATEYWRTLACFTKEEHATAWRRGWDRAEVRSYQVFNVWRIVQPAYEDYMPLGMVCRSSIRPSDIVRGLESLPGSPDGQASSFLRLRYSPTHDWRYFSHMQHDEMIVFQSFALSKDSSVSSRPGCFHAALDNSSSRFTRPERASCEYRIGVFMLD